MGELDWEGEMGRTCRSGGWDCAAAGWGRVVAMGEIWEGEVDAESV